MDNLKEKGRRVGRALNAAAIPFVLMAQHGDIDDVTITENAELFPAWDEHWTGKAGTILLDGGALYKSIHDVSAGQNTKPSQTPSMWTRIGNPAEEYPAWIQPIGAHDAYPAGAKVTHGGKRWLNAHGDGNIWEPGVFGWNEVVEAGDVSPWVSGEAIALGDRRAYNGAVYECIAVDGAGANVWTPDLVPALWKAVT